MFVDEIGPKPAKHREVRQKHAAAMRLLQYFGDFLQTLRSYGAKQPDVNRTWTGTQTKK